MLTATGVFRSVKSIERGFKKRVSKPLKSRASLELSRCYRKALDSFGNICFIGVTGSCGKTTTTELTAAILAKDGRVRKGSYKNCLRDCGKTILGISPKDRYCISEISGHEAGAVAEVARLLRPRIGVVTHVGQDHYSSFRTLEATAIEKGSLIEALPPDGVAVLNADDAHVWAMRKGTRARVITYGRSLEAMLRAENVTCRWPERMSLEVCHAGKRLRVQTRLLGEHWAHVVLASLAVAVAAGIPLDQAAEAVEAFEPVPHRMSPHEVAGGVTFISDTWKAPLWTVSSCLAFLRAAQAERKLLVVGSISDTSKGFYHRYKAVAKEALDIAEKIMFVGDHAHAALKARPHPEDERIMAFDSLRQLDLFLRAYLEPGDLVMLKGTTRCDHLNRLILARTDDIACWRENCRRPGFCQGCRYRHDPFDPVEESMKWRQIAGT